MYVVAKSRSISKELFCRCMIVSGKQSPTCKPYTVLFDNKVWPQAGIFMTEIKMIEFNLYRVQSIINNTSMFAMFYTVL